MLDKILKMLFKSAIKKKYSSSDFKRRGYGYKKYSSSDYKHHSKHGHHHYKHKHKSFSFFSS